MRLAAGERDRALKLRYMMHFRLFDENFSDTEDTVIIIDEIQESAEIYNRIREFTRQFRCRFIVTGSYLGRIYEPEFRYSSGMLQVFKSIPYHMKNFWKQRIRIYLKNISCLEKNWIQ